MMAARVRAAAVLLCVLGAGILLGVFVERHHFSARPAHSSAAAEHAAALADLAAYVDLDQEQMAKVHAIMSERREVVQKLWEQLRPEVQTAVRDVHEEIAEVLRPDQRRRYHDWLMRRAEREHGPSDALEHDR